MGLERPIAPLLIEIDFTGCVYASEQNTSAKNKTGKAFIIKTVLVLHANETGIFMMFVL
jgi:hypothetical protein